MKQKIRSLESPLNYRDYLMLKEMNQKVLDDNALTRKIMRKLEEKINPKIELVDIKEAKKICGRSVNTIKNKCEVIKKGVQGKHLYDRSEVELLRK